MLPNLGYFRGIDCPALKHGRECGRPYCQFRHADITAGCSKVSTPISLDAVNKAIKNLKNSIGEISNIALSSDSDIDQSATNTTDQLTAYKPYHAAAELYKGIGNSENSSVQPIDHSTLQQKPLRKSFLQGAKGSSNKHFRSMCQKKKSKVKYTLKPSSRPVNDLEYDPLCNYDVPDVTEKQNKQADEFNSSDVEDLPSTDLVIDDFSEENNDEEVVEVITTKEECKQKRSVMTNDNSNTKTLEQKSNACDVEKPTDDQTREPSSGVIDLTLWESDIDDGVLKQATLDKVKDDDLFGTDSESDVMVVADENAGKKDTGSSGVVATPTGPSTLKIPGTDVISKQKNCIKTSQSKAKTKNTKQSFKSKGCEVDPSKAPQKKVKNEKHPDLKKKQKRKNSDSISSRPKKIQAMAKTPNIADYVDKKEIEKLDEELNGLNAFEECFQIYKESFTSSGTKTKSDVQSNNDKIQAKVQDIVPIKEPVQTVIPQKSVRKAHNSASSSAQALLRVPKKAKRFPTPAQAMLDRLKTLKEEEQLKILNAAKANLSQLSKTSKGRVAHFPSRNISSGSLSISRKHQLTKHVNDTTSSMSVLPASSGHVRKPFADLARSVGDITSQGTVTKGCKRVAHVQIAMATKNNETMEKPRIQPDRFSKVPTNIRQRYLTLFIDECMRIFDQDCHKAYTMAEMEEKQCKDRSNMRSIYMSVAASTLKKLRSMDTIATTKNDETKKVESSETPSAVVFKANGIRVAHGSSAIKNKPGKLKIKPDLSTKRQVPKNKPKQTFSVLPKENHLQLSNEEIYEQMCKYIMTEEQLDENGYPRPGNVPGSCEFRVEKQKLNKDPTKKICSRCGKEFVLYKGGRFAKQDDECIYHWGRAYITKVGSTREKRYNCCQNTVGSEGCSVGETHVHQDNKLDTSGYVQTLDKSSEGKMPGIYSLDCEMVQSTVGLELVRVSVVNYDCNVVYDTFVYPEGKILDYNTRWSGVTDKHLVGVTTTLRDVQAQFLSKFSSDTILMGHSLESDLIALRIIHTSVVDTSIVFPHRLGPPYKRALRNLMSEYLGVLIQNADDEGHDSSEDASACVRLMRWKIEEDMKVRRP